MQLGKAIGNRKCLPERINNALSCYYTSDGLPIRHMLDCGDAEGSTGTTANPLLDQFASFHPYLILNGCHVIPSTVAQQSCTSPSRSVLVKARVGASFEYGEVTELFVHQQSARQPTVFAFVRWMTRLSDDQGPFPPMYDDHWTPFM